MSKHTPGPWRVFEDRREDSGQSWVAGYNIACIASGEAIVGDEGISGGENDHANARLIAAAPLLLEALIELSREEWRDDDDPILSKARRKARAAIAAATGEDA